MLRDGIEAPRMIWMATQQSQNGQSNAPDKPVALQSFQGVR
jgi:hypothetical protein